MLPFIIEDGELPFKKGDYILISDIKNAVQNKIDTVKAYVLGDKPTEFELTLAGLTDDERDIILAGCLINYYKN